MSDLFSLQKHEASWSVAVKMLRHTNTLRKGSLGVRSLIKGSQVLRFKLFKRSASESCRFLTLFFFFSFPEDLLVYSISVNVQLH